MLICAIDLAGRDSRPHGGLSEVEVTGVTMSESGAPAANPATTPNSTPAVAHAAQGPAPLFAASGPSPVFGSGPADADRHASQPASDEAPEAQHADRHAGPSASDEAPEAQDTGMLS